MPTGEVNIVVLNLNGVSNAVDFVRKVSPVEAAEEAISRSPLYQEIIASLNDMVNASFQPSTGLHLVSYSVGIYESDDGEVYIDLGIHGVDSSDLPDVPDEIAGYEVRLQLTSG